MSKAQVTQILILSCRIQSELTISEEDRLNCNLIKTSFGVLNIH